MEGVNINELPHLTMLDNKVEMIAESQYSRPTPPSNGTSLSETGSEGRDSGWDGFGILANTIDFHRLNLSDNQENLTIVVSEIKYWKTFSQNCFRKKSRISFETDKGETVKLRHQIR